MGMAKSETPNQRVRRLVRFYTAKWVKLLDFEWFTIQHKWIDSGEEDDGGITRTAADTTALWEYRYAKVRWYLPNLSNQTDDQIEECVVHELGHCLIASMEEHIKDKYLEQREYAVQTLTLGLLAVHRRSKD